MLLVCVCSLRYPACIAHAPYCHLRPVQLHVIFPTLSHKRHDCWKNVFEHKIGVLIFSVTLPEKFRILGRTERDAIKMYLGFHLKCPLFLFDFDETWIFLTCFRKMLKNHISWNTVQWEQGCSMRTHGRSDMTKLIFAFRNFCKRAQKFYLSPPEDIDIFCMFLKKTV